MTSCFPAKWRDDRKIFIIQRVGKLFTLHRSYKLRYLQQIFTSSRFYGVVNLRLSCCGSKTREQLECIRHGNVGFIAGSTVVD